MLSTWVDIAENYVRQQRLWNVFVQAFFAVCGHPQKVQELHQIKFPRAVTDPRLLPPVTTGPLESFSNCHKVTKGLGMILISQLQTV